MDWDQMAGEAEAEGTIVRVALTGSAAFDIAPVNTISRVLLPTSHYTVRFFWVRVTYSLENVTFCDVL
jgi:hypothetical protein